jgi:Rps23 Pro-64 3,4-dihydroxylase Tpa1-like proline 4-hydroxylase
MLFLTNKNFNKQNNNKQNNMTINFEEYKTKGYTVIDNFLPLEIANKINQIYVSQTNWAQQDQVREHHYEHVFKTDSESLPKPGENYIAKFGRSGDIEKNQEFLKMYTDYIIPLVSKASGINLSHFDIRCYRLIAGDLYRTHIDDYAADVGLIYYVNKNWRWDWGGILHIAEDKQDKSLVSVLPVFNRAVVLNHGVFRFPHFVSSVEKHALEPRYSIVSFNR